MKLTPLEVAALAVAGLRSAMSVVFVTWFLISPEPLLPGSTTEPAWSIAVPFMARLLLFALVLGVLALRKAREPVAWLLVADVVMQLVDGSLAVAGPKPSAVAFPLIIGVLEVVAAAVLLRGLRRSLVPSHG